MRHCPLPLEVVGLLLCTGESLNLGGELLILGSGFVNSEVGGRL